MLTIIWIIFITRQIFLSKLTNKLLVCKTGVKEMA